jgi:sterol 3beta-glucosyltransferase
MSSICFFVSKGLITVASSWSKSYTYSDITYRFATRDLNQAKSEASTFWGHHSFSVEIKGHPTLYFATQGIYVRDSLVRRLNSARDQSLSTGFIPTLPSIGTPPEPSDDGEPTSGPSLAGSDGSISSTLIEPGISPTLSDSEHSCAALATAYLAPLNHTINFARQIEIPLEALSVLPRPINIPHNVLGGMKSRHFICLSIGSRGDVQ